MVKITIEIGVVVDRLAEEDQTMEIDQIPLFARMIDGRNRTSVRIPIMVANGRRKDMETQEVRSSGQSYHISIKLN